MKAMIFAAGKGTRLKPLTNDTPKALVKVNGKPMLEIVIRKLIASGIDEIIINVHYLANQIIQYLENKDNFGIRIEISDETENLLDTGGGLKKASWFFSGKDPFIVHNVDIISNINLMDMIDYHKRTNALATLAVRNRDSGRYFLFNGNHELCGWENTKTSEKIISKDSGSLKRMAFSGIHVINPRLFDYIEVNDKFSIVQSYLELSKKFKISGYEHDKTYWYDIGNIEKLKKAENDTKRNNL